MSRPDTESNRNNPGPLRPSDETWSDFEKGYVPETLNDLLRKRVGEAPDSVFAEWFEHGERLTFRQLDESAARLASSLSVLGVRKTSHVAALMTGGPEFFFLWFALLRLGAVLVPINDKYTPGEVAYVVNDSDAQFLIASDALLEVARTAEASFSAVEPVRIVPCRHANTEGPTLQQLMDEGDPLFAPSEVVFPSDVANIQYTSGTTGFPKGCILTHEFYSMFTKVGASIRNPKSQAHNVLNWAPLFYIDGQTMSLMALTSGATLFVPRKMSATHFVDWLKDYQINICTLPEPVARIIMKMGISADLHLKHVNAFNWHNEVRAYFVNSTGVTARNAYGMTEIGATLLTPRSAATQAVTPTVGIPGPFREVRIMRPDGSEVTHGETGELWVRGKAMFLGYYKRAKANSESFCGEWFRTGDLFRQDEHGYFQIVGRTKEMIKRAGENIAAREVEASVKSVDGVEDAIVIAAPDPVRVEEVFAIVKTSLPPAEQTALTASILERCSRELAAFKVPRYVQYVTDFPYTPTGKIKRADVVGQVSDLLADCYDRKRNGALAPG